MADATAGAKTQYQPRLADAYQNELRKQLMDELKLSNVYEAPELEKIVINAGLGRAKDDKKLIEIAENTILKITGQKPVRTVAKNAIASFKLREGNIIGVKLTLRGNRMYEFADRFINLVLPRLRDFHGVSTSAFDKQGNYSIGLVDQSVFPELNYEDYATTHGLQVIFNIKAKDPAHSRILLEKLGMPFEKEGDR
jgi:large subunit ribosomal protein L5